VRSLPGYVHAQDVIGAGRLPHPPDVEFLKLVDPRTSLVDFPPLIRIDSDPDVRTDRLAGKTHPAFVIFHIPGDLHLDQSEPTRHRFPRQALHLLIAVAEPAGSGRIPGETVRVELRNALLLPLLHDGHHRLTPNQAAIRGKSLEPYDLFWLEDCTPAENQEALRRVRSQTTTPLAIGEIFNTVYDYQTLITEQIDPLCAKRCHPHRRHYSPEETHGLRGDLPDQVWIPRTHR
jgi:hypothetical protein